MTEPSERRALVARAEELLERVAGEGDQARLELLEDLYEGLEEELDAGEAPPAGR